MMSDTSSSRKAPTSVVTASAGASLELPKPVPLTTPLLFLASTNRQEPILRSDPSSITVPETGETGSVVLETDPETPLLELRIVSQYASVADYRARYPDVALSDEQIVSLLRRASASIDSYASTLRAVWRVEHHPYGDDGRIYPRRNPIQEVDALGLGYRGARHYIGGASPWPYTDIDEGFVSVAAGNAYIVRDLRYVECTFTSKYRFYELAFDPYGTLGRSRGVTAGMRARISYLGGYLPNELPFEVGDVALETAAALERADATPQELVGLTNISQGSQAYALNADARFGGSHAPGLSAAGAAILTPYKNGSSSGGRLA